MFTFQKEKEPHFLDNHPRLKVFLLLILLGLALVIGLTTYAAAKLKQPLNEDGSAKIINIPKGTTSREVARLLEKEKIIGSDRLFIYYLWAKGAREKIQAGQYELSSSLTIPEIVNKLTLG